MSQPTEMERVLILIDDEPNILSALSRIFRREGYRVLTGESGRAGLALLDEHPVAVVISDQRMPHMNGAEFLSEATRRFPDTVRIILSGYTELNSVFDAINRGAVWKFLTKPWDDELLREQVRAAFEQLELSWRNGRLMEEVKAKNDALEALNHQLAMRADQCFTVAATDERSLQQTQMLVDALPVGVLGFSLEGQLVTANKTARTLLPQGASLTGLDIMELEPMMLRHLVLCALDGLHTTDDSLDIDAAQYRLQCRPLPDGSGLLACLSPTDETAKS